MWSSMSNDQWSLRALLSFANLFSTFLTFSPFFRFCFYFRRRDILLINFRFFRFVFLFSSFSLYFANRRRDILFRFFDFSPFCQIFPIFSSKFIIFYTFLWYFPNFRFSPFFPIFLYEVLSSDLPLVKLEISWIKNGVGRLFLI